MLLLLLQGRAPDITLLPAALEQLQQGLLQQVVCCIILPAVRQSVQAGLSVSKRKVFMVGLSRLAAAATAAAAPPAAAEPQMLQQILETLETLISGHDFDASGQNLRCIDTSRSSSSSREDRYTGDLWLLFLFAAATDRIKRRSAVDIDPDDDVRLPYRQQQQQQQLLLLLLLVAASAAAAFATGDGFCCSRETLAFVKPTAASAAAAAAAAVAVDDRLNIYLYIKYISIH